MPRHSETRNLPYTPEQLYELVADVARYKDFLPWVAAVRIRSDSPTLMIADLVVGFGALKETFTSRVKYLHNSWKFRPDGKGGTDLEFCVDFAFKSRIFETLAGQMFDRALRRMIQAFETRAHALYGPGSSDSSDTGISRSSAQSAA